MSASRLPASPAFLFGLFGAALGLLPPGSAIARSFITLQEALTLAFPGCPAERQSVFLTSEQVEAIEKASEGKVESRMVAQYVSRCGKPTDGFAYVDTRVVRTKKQSLLVVVGTDGKARKVELLTFFEPPEYVPPSRWYEKFHGQKLSPELKIKRAIPPVSGATLTARATLEATRLILATHAVLQAEPDGKKP